MLSPQQYIDQAVGAGIPRSAIDSFLAGNPHDEHRIMSALGPEYASRPAVPHSVDAQSNNTTHAAPGVIYAPQPAPSFLPPQPAGEVPTRIYAQPTAVGMASEIMPAATDSRIVASSILPAASAPAGGGPVSVSVTPQVLGPAGSGIPTWAYIVAAGVLLLLFMRRGE